MGAGKGEKRKKGRESARKPGKTNAVRRKRGESHDFSAIALDAYAARTLDLDVLLYGDRTGHEAGMTLPDPHLWERPFLAAAALAVLPGLVVPGTGRPLRELTDPVAVAACRGADAFTERLREMFER